MRLRRCLRSVVGSGVRRPLVRFRLSSWCGHGPFCGSILRLDPRCLSCYPVTSLFETSSSQFVLRIDIKDVSPCGCYSSEILAIVEDCSEAKTCIEVFLIAVGSALEV